MNSVASAGQELSVTAQRERQRRPHQQSRSTITLPPGHKAFGRDSADDFVKHTKNDERSREVENTSTKDKKQITIQTKAPTVWSGPMKRPTIPTVTRPPMQPEVPATPAPVTDLRQRAPWASTNITAAVMTLMKHEEAYVADWVKYHIALGFDRFIIYENSPEPVHEKVLLDAKINPRYFTVRQFPGLNYDKPVQRLVLIDFLRRAQQGRDADDSYDKNSFFKGITHYAHIDVDEFIVLKKHASIKELISEYFRGQCAGLSMSYRHFGSGGQKQFNKLPVPVRFVTSGPVPGRDDIMKSIVETSRVAIAEVHNAYYHENGTFYTCTTSAKKVTAFMRVPEEVRDVVQLNHYRAHSYEEFMRLDQRKRPGFVLNDRHVQFSLNETQQRFSWYDSNDVTDLHAYNFWMLHVQDADFSK